MALVVDAICMPFNKL